MKKDGSCLILVIIISAIILLYYINSWHSTCLMTNVFYKRFEYEKKFRLTESLYKYGLLFFINNSDLIQKQKEQNIKHLNIYNGPWPFDSLDNIGFLRLTYLENDKIKLEAIITDKLKEAFIINAELEIEEIVVSEKNKLKKISILNWQIN